MVGDAARAMLARDFPEVLSEFRIAFFAISGCAT
jgi:hypothetical protein